jgi:peroxiredoxin
MQKGVIGVLFFVIATTLSQLALVLSLVPANGAVGVANAESLTDLKHELNAIQEEHGRKAAAAKSDKEVDELMTKRWKNMGVLARRALNLAARHPGEPIALEARCWVICGGLGFFPETEEAFRLLMDRHIKDGRLAPVCEIAAAYWTNPVAEQFLRRALSGSPSREVRGKAAYALAQCLERATREQLRQDPAGTARRRAEAERLLERVLNEYADVPAFHTTLGEEADGILFRRRHLDIGKQVPDFQCVDANGRVCHLTDYRGKVIVLDFWYVECGPCRARFPGLRKLAECYARRPFALLLVSGDEDKSKWQSFLAKEPVPGTQWYSGPKGVVERWGIYTYPFVFIIDAEGRIRNRNPRPAELDGIVSKLVVEAETKR